MSYPDCKRCKGTGKDPIEIPDRYGIVPLRCVECAARDRLAAEAANRIYGLR